MSSPKLVFHSYIKHTLNQSSFVLLASYAFDALVNQKPQSIALFVNLLIFKFINDVGLRSMLKNVGGIKNQRISDTNGVFNNVIPYSRYLGNMFGNQSRELHQYYAPSGTIALFAFYFTYLIIGMMQRKETNIMRIILYAIILILLIIFKFQVGTPGFAIWIGLGAGILFGIMMSYITGVINMNYLPSGINQEGCPDITVKCQIN